MLFSFVWVFTRILTFHMQQWISLEKNGETFVNLQYKVFYWFIRILFKRSINKQTISQLVLNILSTKKSFYFFCKRMFINATMPINIKILIYNYMMIFKVTKTGIKSNIIQSNRQAVLFPDLLSRFFLRFDVLNNFYGF